MTVSSTINRIAYTGNDVTTEFDVPFAFFEEDELQVIERELATGFETIKSLNNDYFVEDGAGSVGKVVAVQPPSSMVSWTILRRTKRTQLIDYTENDPFPAETHERGLDRATMIAQDSASSVDRSIRFPATDPATLNPEVPNDMLRAGKYLAFDSAGLPIASAGPTGASEIPVSSFMETLLDDTDAASARATLGLIIGSDVSPAGVNGDFVGRVTCFVGTTPPPGWLLLNGETIGNTSSGADHENADYEELFILLWNAMSDAAAMVLPSPPGRDGQDAPTGWSAGKQISLPDLRGRSIIGTGTGAGLTARPHGEIGGAETHLLTSAESGLPAHNHTYNRYQGGHVQGENNGSPNTWFNVITTNTGTVSAQDAASAHNNMQPFLALNYIVKYLGN